MTNEELKQKCLEYDKTHYGARPEGGYEGMDLYNFITTGETDYSKEAAKAWEIDLKNFIPGITMEINGYHLKMTCEACPEQYDVFKDGNQVGYLRLRHGKFTVETPKCDGEMVFEGHPIGEGIFVSEERKYYLTEAIKEIDKSLNPD